MTTPITKEQLRAYAEKKVNSLRFAIKQSAFTGITEGLEKELHLAEFALAAMGAEPVAFTDERNLNYINIGRETSLIWGQQNKEDGDIPLYRHAQPAPVSVPDEMDPTVEAIKRVLPTSNPDEYAACIGADMWNTCRSAMLQGADGALICEGTKQTDELVMWIKRLAYSLKKANPDSKLQNDAMEYLSRKGLIHVEDVLR